MVVMPGGVDIHSHIAGPKVNLARKLLARGARAARRPRTASSCARHRRHGAVHVHDRLPLRAARLHDGRSRPPSRRWPPATSLAELRDTPLDRQGVLRPDGQQPGAVRADATPASRERAARRDRLVARARPAATASSSSTRAASSCGSSGNGERHVARRDRGRLRRHAAAGHRRDRRRRRRARPAAPRAHPLPTTSACPATRAPRSTRCARSTGAGRTSPTCSSTATAATPDGAPALAARPS